MNWALESHHAGGDGVANCHYNRTIFSLSIIKRRICVKIKPASKFPLTELTCITVRLFMGANMSCQVLLSCKALPAARM